MTLEPNTGIGYTYFWWTVFTQPSTPEDIKVQFATLQNTGETVTGDEIRIIAIQLTDDLTEDTDWHFNEDSTGGSTTGDAFGSGQTDRATVTFTAAGEDWLILSRANIGVDSEGSNYEIGLLESDTLVRKHIALEGEDLTEIRMHTIPYVAEALSSGSHTFNVQVRDDGATHTYNSAGVFALNLDKFESHAVIQNTGLLEQVTNNVFQELATLGTYAPDTTGDHLVIADALDEFSFSNITLRLQFDGTSEPTNWETLPQWTQWDGTDQVNIPMALMTSIASAGEDIDLDGKSSTINTDWFDRTIIAFSMELVSVGGAGKIIIQNAA